MLSGIKTNTHGRANCQNKVFPQFVSLFANVPLKKNTKKSLHPLPTPRDKKKNYIHIEKVFISLKICNSNYFSVKILIRNENRFNAITPIAKKGERKETISPCGEKS